MNNKKENFWIPYADLMTVLMVVFLFISISYMGLVQYQKKQQDKIFEDYRNTKQNLYKELNREFKDDFLKWSIVLDNDLSIKFTNPEVLFPSGKAEITTKFEDILNDFVPKYLNILLDKKYENKIAEIRIEGHTDDVAIMETNDSYMDNIKLSQERSRSVLKFLRSTSYFKSLSDDKKNKLQFLLTANGLSYGRTLDSDKKLTYYSNNAIDKKNSRRVEFRIVTTSESLIENVLKNLE
ncbi:MAG: OmpA/MotB family protein [Flavobacterium sp.]